MCQALLLQAGNLLHGGMARATLTEKLQGPSERQRSPKGQHTFWIDEESPGTTVCQACRTKTPHTAALCFLGTGLQAGRSTSLSTPDMADKDAAASGLGTSLT